MLTRKSIEGRLVQAFGIFAFVITLIFGLLVLGAVHLAEDRIVARVLEIQLADYVERRGLDPSATLPSGRGLGATFDRAALPEPARELARVADDGVYEVTSALSRINTDPEPELHLAMHTFDNGQRFYLYLDARQVEVLDESVVLVTWILAAGVCLMTLVGAILGRATARRLINPLSELARRVKEADPHRSTRLSQGFTDDEVGLLARALDASMDRSQAFLDRERRFTRDASHELRTPVTVVRGAVELLEALPEAEQPRWRRPIERIRRANDSMAQLIEAFLWLAREEALAEGANPRSLAAEADAAVASYRHLLEGKSVTVEQSIPWDARVRAPDGVLGIVLGNLVGNAFHFTQQGSIQLLGDAHHFEVRDTGPGVEAEELSALRDAHRRGERSEGFGLGLAIVSDLCDRFDWRLDLESPGDGGFRAAVHFGSLD